MENLNIKYQFIEAYDLINKAKDLAFKHPEFADAIKNDVDNLLYNVSPYEALKSKILSINITLKQREKILLIEKNKNK